MKKKAIICLSGGLDSVVSAYHVKRYTADISLCLFFDYGQKALKHEKKTAKFFAEHLGAKFISIKLPFLNEISGSSLTSKKETPSMTFAKLQDEEYTNETMLNVWVPNRNGLFINVAASYADSIAADYIICGFNAEEAETFSDNSIEFINKINQSLKYSTLHKVKVIAPFYRLSKSDIVKKALNLKVPLSKIYSCYNSEDKQCGVCESCIRFKRALEENNIDYSSFFMI